MLEQAWNQGIKPILVLNKIDRLILEKKLEPADAYTHINQVLEQVNRKKKTKVPYLRDRQHLLNPCRSESLDLVANLHPHYLRTYVSQNIIHKQNSDVKISASTIYIMNKPIAL